jgi:hypothetical protein
MGDQSLQFICPNPILLALRYGGPSQILDRIEKPLAWSPGFLGKDERGSKRPFPDIILVVELSEDSAQRMGTPRSGQHWQVREAPDDIGIGDRRTEFGLLLKILSDFLDRRFHDTLALEMDPGQL